MVIHLHDTALTLRTMVSARRFLRIAQFGFTISKIFVVDEVLFIRGQVDVYSLGRASRAYTNFRNPFFSASSFGWCLRNLGFWIPRRLASSCQIRSIARSLFRAFSLSLYIRCRLVKLKLVIFSFLHDLHAFRFYVKAVCLTIWCLRYVIIRVTWRRVTRCFNVLETITFPIWSHRLSRWTCFLIKGHSSWYFIRLITWKWIQNLNNRF